MNEARMLRRIARGDSAALGAVMDAYSAYVYAIMQNIVQPPLRPGDCEEVTADVFLQLWRNAESVEEGKLKAWLAAVTRNRAKDRLRSLHLTVPLEDEVLLLSVPGPEDTVERLELQRLTRRAVESLPEPDRSIFMRHYYLYQKTDDIAAALGMKSATVRTRLARGREKLKAVLREGGYNIEAADS